MNRYLQSIFDYNYQILQIWYFCDIALKNRKKPKTVDNISRLREKNSLSTSLQIYGQKKMNFYLSNIVLANTINALMQLQGTQIADYKLTYSENNITTTN